MTLALAAFSCRPDGIPPKPEWLVTDPAGWLRPDGLELDQEAGRFHVRVGTRHQLLAKLMAYRAATHHELLVWIADRPVEGPIPQFCHQTFNAWGPGRRGYNDGVIVFLFPVGDRFRMWVTVGRGLDQVLTSEETSRLAHLHGPEMEAGQRDAGLNALVDDIIAVIGAK